MSDTKEPFRAILLHVMKEGSFLFQKDVNFLFPALETADHKCVTNLGQRATIKHVSF